MNYMNQKMNNRTMKAKRGKNRKEWMTSNGQMDKFNERHLKAFFSQNILFVHEHTWHTLICTVYRFVKLIFFSPQRNLHHYYLSFLSYIHVHVSLKTDKYRRSRWFKPVLHNYQKTKLCGFSEISIESTVVYLRFFHFSFLLTYKYTTLYMYPKNKKYIS